MHCVQVDAVEMNAAHQLLSIQADATRQSAQLGLQARKVRLEEAQHVGSRALASGQLAAIAQARRVGRATYARLGCSVQEHAMRQVCLLKSLTVGSQALRLGQPKHCC